MPLTDRSRQILKSVGKELKENPPEALAKTKAKSGAGQAKKQGVAILLSKARKRGAKVGIKR